MPSLYFYIWNTRHIFELQSYFYKYSTIKKSVLKFNFPCKIFFYILDFCIKKILFALIISET